MRRTGPWAMSRPCSAEPSWAFLFFFRRFLRRFFVGTPLPPAGWGASPRARMSRESELLSGRTTDLLSGAGRTSVASRTSRGDSGGTLSVTVLLAGVAFAAGFVAEAARSASTALLRAAISAVVSTLGAQQARPLYLSTHAARSLVAPTLPSTRSSRESLPTGNRQRY